MAAMSCFSTFITGEPVLAVLPRRSGLPSVALQSSRRPAAVVLRAAAASKTTTAEAVPEAAKKRQPRGITKPRPVSPELQALLGVKEIPRTQALKLIWAYIKENELQVFLSLLLPLSLFLSLIVVLLRVFADDFQSSSFPSVFWFVILSTLNSFL